MPTIDTINEEKEFSWEDYEAPSQFVRPPDPGIYSFTRTDADGDLKHGTFTTRDGKEAEWFNFKAEIQGGPADGRTVFGGCNTLLSTFRQGHTAADFLMASRSSLRPKKGEYLAAIEKTFGPFNAKTRWEIRCKDCEITFLQGGPKSMKPPKKFGTLPQTYKVSKNADGTFNHVQACPSCNQPTGANLVITDFVVGATGKVASVPASAPAPEGLPPAEG